MRILDVDNNIAINNTTLYLRIEEAKELYDSIGALLKANDFSEHIHINDASYEHEITIVLYDEQQMGSLSERSQKIILKDV